MDIDRERIPEFWSFKIACGYWTNHGTDVVMVTPMRIMRPPSFSRIIRTLIQIGRRRKRHSAQRGKRGSPARTCRPGTPRRSSVGRRGTSSPSACAQSTSHAMLRDTLGQSPIAPSVPRRRLTEMNLLSRFHEPISQSAFSSSPSPFIFFLFLIVQPLPFWSDFSHSLIVIICEKNYGVLLVRSLLSLSLSHHGQQNHCVFVKNP